MLAPSHARQARRAPWVISDSHTKLGLSWLQICGRARSLEHTLLSYPSHLRGELSFIYPGYDPALSAPCVSPLPLPPAHSFLTLLLERHGRPVQE